MRTSFTATGRWWCACSEGLLVDEDGIWRHDENDNYFSDLSNVEKTKQSTDDVDISELEMSRSTSAQGSDLFRPFTAVVGLHDDLQLPELAAGYCTSESEPRGTVSDDHNLIQSNRSPISGDGSPRHSGEHPTGAPPDETRWMSIADNSPSSEDDDAADAAAVEEFEKLELAVGNASLEYDPQTPATDRSENTFRSQLSLPAYVRRETSIPLSPDQSPERTDSNFQRTYTVRQSKKNNKTRSFDETG